MSQIALEIPTMLANLPSQERNRLIRSGVYEATRTRVRQLEKEISEGKEHIKGFQNRYGVSFIEFETDLLPTLDTFQTHEDYNDWFFWQTVLTKNQDLLSKMKRVEPN